MGVLDGRRVVVTRPAEQAAPLVDALTALGAEVIRLPLIAVVEPDDGGAALRDALAHLDEIDWLVVTSPNGAERVAAALSTRPTGAPWVAAVGAATEAALGRAADLVPTDQITEGLLAAFPVGSGTVLLAVAQETRPDLAAGLADKGWTVRRAPAYRTAIAPGELTSDPVWMRSRDAAVEADAVLFTSGSAVRGWASAVRSPTPATMVAIGPATADVARQESLKITHVAADHSIAGLVATTVVALTGREAPDQH